MLSLPGSSGPPRQGIGVTGGDCLSLAPPGSSGPPRQGIGVTGGDCLSLAPPGSSGPPRQSVGGCLSRVGGSLSLFPFLSGTRARHSLEGPEELPTSGTLCTKFVVIYILT